MSVRKKDVAKVAGGWRRSCMCSNAVAGSTGNESIENLVGKYKVRSETL